MRAAVLTVSDGVAAGEREDGSGDVLAELLAGDGYEVERRIVPDDREAIADAIVELAEDAVLARIPEARRQTLLARPDADSPGRWLFDLRLQGFLETVFFDV